MNLKNEIIIKPGKSGQPTTNFENYFKVCKICGVEFYNKTKCEHACDLCGDEDK